MPEKLSKRTKEQATLYVMGILSPKEKATFEQELARSDRLKTYMDELSSALRVVSHLPSKQPSETLLNRQRNLLRGRIDMLNKEHFYRTVIRKIQDVFWSISDLLLFSRRPALAAVTYLLLGLIAGRFLFFPVVSPDLPTIAEMTVEERIRQIINAGELPETQILPLRNGNNKVAFRLKAEDDFEYSGGLKDETVRELLSYLLLNETNPGKRLKSLKLMSDLTPDEEMKMVLVAALLSDENPGVRLRAIKSLAGYPVDKTVRDACTKILLEEQNTAIRMEALNILAKNPDDRLIPVLQVVSRLDSNEYIREEATAILDELGDPFNSKSIEEIQ